MIRRAVFFFVSLGIAWGGTINPATGWVLASAAFADALQHVSVSMRALRYEDVVGQSDWHTCGAAAVATWLTYYLGRPVSEAEVLAVAGRVMDQRGQEPAGGLSMLALRDAMQEYGVRAVGYRVSVDHLLAYFRGGGLPVLLHLSEPELHYVLAIGVWDDYMILADPSFGRSAVKRFELVEQKGFTGAVLVADVDTPTAQIARAKQQEVIAFFADRLIRLKAMRWAIRW